MPALTSLKPDLAKGRPFPASRNGIVGAAALAGERLSSWIALLPVIGISGTLLAMSLAVARALLERGR